jgi:hypothetical protein
MGRTITAATDLAFDLAFSFIHHLALGESRAGGNATIALPSKGCLICGRVFAVGIVPALFLPSSLPQ